MKYRADISGLRALAVVPVVLYHAHAALMPGGFVGVDVFFVISGYLITAIIAGDLAQGRFSLLTFYDRRIRRIVPAYALVMGGTLLAALVSLPPLMLAFFGKSLEFASVFLANKHFLATAGYFQPGVEELPLLHTWSLAVEEQFYLFWPLALFALSHRACDASGAWWCGRCSSLRFMCEPECRAAAEQRLLQFHLPGLGASGGGVLALGLLPRLRGRLLPELAALIGVGLIGWALFTFSRTTVFPGLNALFPVGGALLILWAGEEGRQTLVGRVLGLAPSPASASFPIRSISGTGRSSPSTVPRRAAIRTLWRVWCWWGWRFGASILSGAMWRRPSAAMRRPTPLGNPQHPEWPDRAGGACRDGPRHPRDQRVAVPRLGRDAGGTGLPHRWLGRHQGLPPGAGFRVAMSPAASAIPIRRRR